MNNYDTMSLAVSAVAVLQLQLFPVNAQTTETMRLTVLVTATTARF